MEETTTVWVAGCALALFIGLLAGYQIGARKAKRRRRELQQSLSALSVDLLDVRTENRELTRFLGAAERKDRLLKLALNKLKVSNGSLKTFEKREQELERQHFIERSRLNMTAIESKQQAKVAADVARKASFRLRLLERALPQLQTITAPEPKSYGQGEPVMVSVVDQQPKAAKHDQANAVTNRDLHRLSAMQPSNEQVRERPDNTVSFHPAPSAKQTDVSPAQTEQNLNKKETITRAT